MSIIYDALQKTQQSRESLDDLSNPERMTRDDWIDVGLALVIAFLLGLLIIAHYPKKSVTKVFHQTRPTLDHQAIIMPPSQVVTSVTETPEIKAKQTVKKPNPPPFDTANYKSKHLLTGIFISENEKVALIDNQFYNIGDTVDGMELFAIEPDQVRLKNNQISLVMRLKV